MDESSAIKLTSPSKKDIDTSLSEVFVTNGYIGKNLYVSHSICNDDKYDFANTAPYLFNICKDLKLIEGSDYLIVIEIYRTSCSILVIYDKKYTQYMSYKDVLNDIKTRDVILMKDVFIAIDYKFKDKSFSYFNIENNGILTSMLQLVRKSFSTLNIYPIGLDKLTSFNVRKKET